MQISTSEDSIILDFFSGSATTAHAVMHLNAEDGGNRKFIMVQIPEETDEKAKLIKPAIRISAKSVKNGSVELEKKLKQKTRKQQKI